MAKSKQNKILKQISDEVKKGVDTIEESILRVDLNKETKRIDKSLKGVDKGVGKEVEEVERWVIERRKFFIRLGIFIVFLIFVLIYKWFFMK